MKRPLPLQFRDVVGSKISVILSVNRPLDGVLRGGRDRTLMVKMLGKEKVMRGTPAREEASIQTGSLTIAFTQPEMEGSPCPVPSQPSYIATASVEILIVPGQAGNIQIRWTLGAPSTVQHSAGTCLKWVEDLYIHDEIPQLNIIRYQSTGIVT